MSHGNFVWYELMTTDLKGAEAFYTSVVGWNLRPAGFEEVKYTILLDGAAGVGGILDLPADVLADGARPAWIGYIAVDDVDLYQQRVVAAGGSVHRPAADIPHVGRFAVVADPQHAPFVLFKPNPAPADTPSAGCGPGTVGWRELMAVDWSTAFDFYAGLFGWRKATPYDMGPMGTYQLWDYGESEPVGGMMTKPAAVPSAFWSYYIRVDSIAAAIARVNAAGGRIVNGPMQVPGDEWIVQGFDPQGAFFCLLSGQA